jgi:hypothetical protein
MAGALLVLVGAAAAIAIYAGLYNIAADVPYPQPVYWLCLLDGAERRLQLQAEINAVGAEARREEIDSSPPTS